MNPPVIHLGVMLNFLKGLFFSKSKETSASTTRSPEKITPLNDLLQESNQPANADSPTGNGASQITMKDRFGKYGKPAILLQKVTTNNFTRLGGLPDIPPEMQWPEWNGKPMSFLAQLDLEQLHKTLPSVLPNSGYLYFFYDQEQNVWGFDPKDIGGWKVMFTKENKRDFVRREPPSGLPPEQIFTEKNVTPVKEIILPDSQLLPDDEYSWKSDGDDYYAFRDEVFKNQPRHQVLGYCSPIQNADMETECQLVSNGIYLGSANGFKDSRVPELSKGSSEWKLLLQLDTDDETGWMWGDVGTLYFWIRESDAAAEDFSKVWMVFQCS